MAKKDKRYFEDAYLAILDRLMGAKNKQDFSNKREELAKFKEDGISATEKQKTGKNLNRVQFTNLKNAENYEKFVQKNGRYMDEVYDGTRSASKESKRIKRNIRFRKFSKVLVASSVVLALVGGAVACNKKNKSDNSVTTSTTTTSNTSVSTSNTSENVTTTNVTTASTTEEVTTTTTVETTVTKETDENDVISSMSEDMSDIEIDENRETSRQTRETTTEGTTKETTRSTEPTYSETEGTTKETTRETTKETTKTTTKETTKETTKKPTDKNTTPTTSLETEPKASVDERKERDITENSYDDVQPSYIEEDPTETFETFFIIEEEPNDTYETFFTIEEPAEAEVKTLSLRK